MSRYAVAVLLAILLVCEEKRLMTNPFSKRIVGHSVSFPMPFGRPREDISLPTLGYPENYLRVRISHDLHLDEDERFAAGSERVWKEVA